MSEKREEAFILWFDEISKGDVGIVGGKNANLGEMYQNLTKAESKLFVGEKINVPYGFAVTAAAYQHFITGNTLDQKIKDALKDLDTHNIKQLEECGHKVRKLILESEFPEDLAAQIKQAYNDLAKKLNLKVEDLDVAARSSATAEDLPDASFAGQQESYLNVRGEYELLESIKKAFSSLFTNRAISYRQDKNFDHFEVKLSVAVQKMARSDRGSSGVMFTIDTESGFEKCVIINGAWGLGEFVVKGVVNPDEFKVFKPTLKQGFKAIISKKLGTKEKKLIYAHEGTVPTKEVPVPDSERHTFVLTDEQILKLAKWGVIIEEHYGRAMDIEWAFDTQENQLYIVQARPETVHAHKDAAVLEEYVLEDKNAKVLLTGVAVGAKIGQGKVRYIKDASKISEFKPGEVLVTEITDPDWEPIMKIASAIVTNSGGRTSHAAIVSRELGIPAIVGSHTATKVLKDGQEVTVSCAEGEVGKIYEGIVKFKVNKTDLTGFVPPKVDIKMIAADPEAAFSYAALPQRGVGLLREEFVISNFIKIHPNALIDFEKLEDKELKKLIEDYTVGYDNKVKFYVEKLAFGLAQLAAAFYPYDVLLRFSDFKSNEYANLIGGKLYEPIEENPMIGWRGASRYHDPRFEKAFSLEVEAVKKVREEMGLYNLSVMVPFCRTPEEGKKVVEMINKYGLTKRITQEELKKKKNGDIVEGMEIWVMAEIPSNVLQVEEFAAIFDGFSIGSNDLTQLTLGLDRDSRDIAYIGNERNASVKKLISMLIKEAHALHRKVGICGQGPSDFPDFAEFLVKEGIDSISINPDTVVKANLGIKKVEEALGR